MQSFCAYRQLKDKSRKNAAVLLSCHVCVLLKAIWLSNKNGQMLIKMDFHRVHTCK